MAASSTSRRPDLAHLPALRITHRGADTDGTCVRAEAVVRPLPGRAASDVPDLPRRRWFEETGALAHVHPAQEEAIEVLDGIYTVRVNGTDRRLAAGERVVIPKNTAHAHWNPGDRLARIAVEHHPASHSDQVFEAMHRLAQAGNAMNSGLPTPLAAALVADRYPDVVYLAGLPVSLQKHMNRVLARIAEALGMSRAIDGV